MKSPKISDRMTKISIHIENDLHLWLWQERRLRERSIAWIINQAISQYRDRLEKGRAKSGSTPEQD